VTDWEATAIIIVSAVESVVHMIKIDKPEIEEDRLIKELSKMITRYLFD